jgi:hypothetical protein
MGRLCLGLLLPFAAVYSHNSSQSNGNASPKSPAAVL